MNARNGLGRDAFLGLGGALIGGALGAWLASSSVAPEPSSLVAPISSETPREGAATPLDAPVSARASASPDDARADADPQACPLYGETQRAHGEQGIREGWRRERKDEPNETEMKSGLATYEGFVRDSPHSIGRQLGAKRNAAEAALADAARGGLFALLARLNEGNVGPLIDEVRDDARLSKYFARSTAGGNVVDGAAHQKHPDKALEDGATLAFPAGVYLIENLLREKHPFPRDVTVSGAGMDATMLVLRGELATNGELVNLTLRDCTIHTNNNYLFDLRVQPASVTLERVRCVGFDMGAGASCLFGTAALAVRARDCQFLGGYGNSPQHCTLFDVRTDALLARFERCRIDQVEMGVGHWYAGATIVFVGCVLNDLMDDRPIESFGHAGVLLDGCSVSYLPNGSQGAQKKDLNALFPDWQQRMIR